MQIVLWLQHFISLLNMKYQMIQMILLWYSYREKPVLVSCETNIKRCGFAVLYCVVCKTGLLIISSPRLHATCLPSSSSISCLPNCLISLSFVFKPNLSKSPTLFSLSYFIKPHLLLFILTNLFSSLHSHFSVLSSQDSHPPECLGPLILASYTYSSCMLPTNSIIFHELSFK